jgi:methionyl-tRNA synthetase
MTRDLKWGTPVPVKGFEEKVFYVWFDACFGYISITANYTPTGWRKWWQAPASSEKCNVQLYQFMGKDNVPFHTVIFPGSLLGTVSEAGQEESQSNGSSANHCPWTLLHHINTTEYLNYESGKFSKSRGIGVFGNDARDSGIPAAVWRYYLLSVRPETTDSTFSWDDFGARNNNELLANLGNFVSRVTKFAAANCDNSVPTSSMASMTAKEEKLVQSVNAELKMYLELMEAVSLRAALKQVMAISSLGNHYLTESGLDRKLLAEDPARCAMIIATALNLVYLIGTIIDPFMPSTGTAIREMLNAPAMAIPDTWVVDALLPGHPLGTPVHLFSRLEEQRLAELRSKFAGKQVK